MQCVLTATLPMPHDIIRKDRRDTLYGHKVFLTAGASGAPVPRVAAPRRLTRTAAAKLADLLRPPQGDTVTAAREIKEVA